MSQTQVYSGSRSRSRQKAKSFRPSDQQIETAKHRMLCTLHKHGGSTPVRSYGDAVDFFCREVTNRGQQLGTYAHKQFKRTIQTAFNQLLAAGDARLDFDEGLLIQITEADTKHKVHHQKYPKRRAAFAVA